MTDALLPRRNLGRSGLRVSPIGLGFMQFSGGRIGSAMFGATDQGGANAVVEAALRSGITFFDTAEFYGQGRSERALSRALETAGDAARDAVVATKWTPFLRTARHLARSASRRQEALAPHPIDLYQIHFPASFSSIPAQMRAMAGLQHRGAIRAVGVSNFSARQMEQAHAALGSEGVALATNQVRVSLLDRQVDRNGVLETARGLGITLIAFGPLAGGVLTGRFHQDPERLRAVPMLRRRTSPYPYSQAGLTRTAPLVDALQEIAQEHGALPAQVALSWLVTFHGETVVAIPGASRPAQAEQNGAALRLRLSDSELSRLDELSRRVST
jgi:aryl-alcohol dehydrogenase-like predicted oxidoreductase